MKTYKYDYKGPAYRQAVDERRVTLRTRVLNAKLTGNYDAEIFDGLTLADIEHADMLACLLADRSTWQQRKLGYMRQEWQQRYSIHHCRTWAGHRVSEIQAAIHILSSSRPLTSRQKGKYVEFCHITPRSDRMMDQSIWSSPPHVKQETGQ